jgi:hypothetical protein
LAPNLIAIVELLLKISILPADPDLAITSLQKKSLQTKAKPLHSDLEQAMTNPHFLMHNK